MYILYADDAGNTGTDYDNKQQPIFSLAGIVVKDNAWSRINDKINVLKQKILPDNSNIEIHATDIFNGKKTKEIVLTFVKIQYSKTEKFFPLL